MFIGVRKTNQNLNLERRQIDLLRVKQDILCLLDGDHTAALSLFENAEVYLSIQEEQLLNGETSRFFFLGNTIDVENYSLLEDQQELTFTNINIKCFLLPGLALNC